MTTLTTDDIWQALDEVKDPEIPVVSLVEMGIIRAVSVDGDHVTVTMTPTFSGCPALHVMRDDILARLHDIGIAEVTVNNVLHPPWTSDWITNSARAKLRDFGLAPPPKHGGSIDIIFYDVAECPHCGSSNTSVRNTFGPTLCRAIYVCNGCSQPFEQFKPI